MKDYLGYKEKICVVVGASSGVGKAVTEMLVDLGAKVYGLARRDVTVSGIEESIHVDISKKESIDQAFMKLPEKIDRFFGCASVFGASNDFLTTVTTDFVSYKYITQAYLSKRVVDGGAIGFITSNNGRRWEEEQHKKTYMDTVLADGWEATIRQIIDSGLAENTGMDGYNFAKRCMNYFITEMAYQLGKRQIRVNYVLPGPINSPMLRKAMEDQNFTFDDLINNVLVNATRIAEPEEVAAPLVFLCSDMASFMSGVGAYTDFGLDAYITIGRSPDVIHGNEKPLKITKK
jgi:NAD(P)-dependent dehydrogenase (short-subunit alcohol dehydrogenase family)